jgi:hypothetical protein
LLPPNGANDVLPGGVADADSLNPEGGGGGGTVDPKLRFANVSSGDSEAAFSPVLTANGANVSLPDESVRGMLRK